MRSLVILIGLAIPLVAFAEEFPSDRPVTTAHGQMDQLIAPYVAMSRKSFSDAKERFLEGLASGHTLYVTVRLMDDANHSLEQVFLIVTKINDQKITGEIASEIRLPHGHKQGDQFECAVNDIYDWTITAPDGSEEGNFVGKFLDVVQDNRVPLLVKIGIAADGSVASAHFERAINRYKQDVSYCIPESAKRKSEQIFLGQKYEKRLKPEDQFGYVIYLFKEDRIEEPPKAQPNAAPAEGQKTTDEPSPSRQPTGRYQ